MSEKLTFSDWQKQVMLAIDRIGRSSYSNLMLDCMIPYRLGWTPERTARAMTYECASDARELQCHQMKDLTPTAPESDNTPV